MLVLRALWNRDVWCFVMWRGGERERERAVGVWEYVGDAVNAYHGPNLPVVPLWALVKDRVGFSVVMYLRLQVTWSCQAASCDLVSPKEALNEILASLQAAGEIRFLKMSSALQQGRDFHSEPCPGQSTRTDLSSCSFLPFQRFRFYQAIPTVRVFLLWVNCSFGVWTAGKFSSVSKLQVGCSQL